MDLKKSWQAIVRVMTARIDRTNSKEERMASESTPNKVGVSLEFEIGTEVYLLSKVDCGVIIITPVCPDHHRDDAITADDDPDDSVSGWVHRNALCSSALQAVAAAAQHNENFDSTPLQPTREEPTPQTATTVGEVLGLKSVEVRDGSKMA
jgi:hypothetical protein